MAVSEHVMLLGQFLHSNGIALGCAIILYCMEKPTSGKSIGTRRGYHGILATQLNICQLQFTLDMYFHHPYIWQHLIRLVRLLFQTFIIKDCLIVCYADKYYLTYTHLNDCMATCYSSLLGALLYNCPVQAVQVA